MSAETPIALTQKPSGAISSEPPTTVRSSFVISFCTPLAIFALTVAAFFPALENGFVNWDDDLNFLENPYYRGLGWAELRWMLATFHGSNYRPVAWMTCGLDYLIWGMEAFGYHLTSIILHGVNAVLAYFLARRLVALAGIGEGRRDGLVLAAFFSALLFSLHPLRVEVVAWASARNDVVAGLFSFLTLNGYLKYAALAEDHPQKRRWLGATLLLYTLSLLSKGTGLMLPLVLLILDVYPLGRLRISERQWFGPTTRGVLLEKLPFVALAAAAGLLAVLAKQSTQGMTPWDHYGLSSRAAEASYGLIFYLVKTLYPVGLSPLYQLSDEFNPSDTVYWLAGLSVLVISAGLSWARRVWPAGLASWMCYLIMLLPVSGFVQSGPQLAADRYSYLACLPWALLAGAALQRTFDSRFGLWPWACSGFRATGSTPGAPIYQRNFAPGSPRFKAGLAVVVGSGILIMLGTLSWRQSQVWHDSGSLWSHALTIDPRSSYAHNNFGNYLQDKERLEEARAHYLKALEINASYAAAHINLGMVLGRLGHIAESTHHFELGLRFDPNSWKGHYYLGVNYAQHRDWQRAAGEFGSAIMLQPNRAELHFDLGNVLVPQGRIQEAKNQFQEALRINPEFAAARRNLETLRALAGPKASQ